MEIINEVKLARGAEPIETHDHPVLKFPPGFLWGTAISGHQVEGGNDKSDWWLWEQNPKHIADKSRSAEAAGHYNFFDEDFSRARQMRMNAQRLSLEWSRIEPEEGRWNEEALTHYRDVLKSLKSRFFNVMLTIHHFTLPQWVADQGGWENPKTIRDFERFARKAASEYGLAVDYWITINEPMIYVSQGYLYGIWPPGKKSLWSSIRVLRHLGMAHKRVYRALHEIMDEKGGKANVSIAQNVISFDPYRKHSLGDIWFVKIADWLWNHMFFSMTRRAHDFIGLNYYFHYRVAFVPSKFRDFFFEVRNENREVSDVGWEVYPPGIFAALQDMAVYKKPIFITENGIACVNDNKRARFLVAHLKEVYHAVQSGVDVRGYFHWSLIDNFEWEKGFGPRFGLIEVNYATLERHPRRSAAVYAEIAGNNGITHDLLRFLGHEISVD